MKKLLAVTAVLLTASLPSAFAQNSAKGSWRFDAAQSDFGSQPKPKSMHLVITKDTPEMLAWHLTEVNAEGKTTTEAWSGAKDGTMHPIKGSEQGGQASFQGSDSDLTINEKMASGGSAVSHVSMSDNGTTMTEHLTGTDKSGNQFTQTIVWHKVTGTKKAAKAAK
ncbi:MAG TPA: hypothetical protein VFW25_01535 [Silvibacterium sp.]|nr:hypothetical protein [Silvibacterium sp.]